MFVGHYSAAFAVKAVQPKTPLWMLFVAVQLVDIVWALLVFAGVERGHLDGTLISNPLVLDYMPYTHSLLGALGWALLAYAVVRWRLGMTAAAVGVALAVLSHFFIDLIVHRPDLTLAGGPHRFGLGLWNSAFEALALELGMLAASLAWCLNATRTADESRRYWWIGYGVLALMQLGMSLGAMPPSFMGVAASALASYLLLAACVWRLEILHPLEPVSMDTAEISGESSHA